jgi:SSS family transporter
MDEAISAAPSLQFFDWAVMVLYLLFVVGLGVLFSRRENTTDDYLLGGRRMPWLIIGISYMVSLMSTISLVSVPGEAFNYGLTKSIHTLLAPLAAVLSFYLFVRFYFMVRTFTPFSYLERRFDRRVRLLASLVFWWTRLAYLAMVLYSSSKVFEGAAGWPVWLTVSLVGVVGIVYTTMGGMKAVVWTDFSQFLILVGGVVLVSAICACSVEGGAPGIVRYAFENGRGFDGVREPDFLAFNPYVRLSLWIMVVAIFSEHMFYNSSDQISIQRLLSTSSYRDATKSLFTFVVIGLPFGCLLWFLGLAIFAYYGQHPSEAGDITGDTALFTFVSVHLPSPIPGLIISAMLAAVMSTLDSGMNSLAAVATKDIYVQYFRPDADERQQVAFARVMTVVVGVFAIGVSLVIAAVATSIGETIMEASAIWMSFGGVLAPVYLIAVTTRKVKGRHILIACLTSWLVTAGVVVWYYLSKLDPDPAKHVSFLFVGVPGQVVVLVLGYLPVFLPGRPEAGKTEGLTLWTLKSDARART